MMSESWYCNIILGVNDNALIIPCQQSTVKHDYMIVTFNKGFSMVSKAQIIPPSLPNNLIAYKFWHVLKGIKEYV